MSDINYNKAVRLYGVPEDVWKILKSLGIEGMITFFKKVLVERISIRIYLKKKIL